MTGKNNRTVWVVGMALAIGAVCHAEAEYKPERYDVILDRSPFGSDPLSASSDSTSGADQATAEKLGEKYRLSFLLESDAGEVRAGFHNMKPVLEEPLRGIIMEGESFMGMKLTSVDMANSEATLEYKGKLITFQLSKALTKAVAAAKKASTSPTRRFGGGFRRKPSTPAPPPQPKLSPEEQKLRRAEIRKNLQDYQMEVIRTGMPPLPVPLTQEMDDQLVAEGVLPPAAVE